MAAGRLIGRYGNASLPATNPGYPPQDALMWRHRILRLHLGTL